MQGRREAVLGDLDLVVKVQQGLVRCEVPDQCGPSEVLVVHLLPWLLARVNVNVRCAWRRGAY